jgi:hypothetical protein
MADLTLEIVGFIAEALKLEFGETHVYETQAAIQANLLPGVSVTLANDQVESALNSSADIRRLTISIAVAHDSRVNVAAARTRAVTALRAVWFPAGAIPHSLTLGRRTFGQEQGEGKLFAETLEVQILYSDSALDLSPV